MTDSKPLTDANDTPEDVATLYSWANLHGAKYRDFSAARAQTREKARLRAEQAIEDHRRSELEQARAAETAEAEAALEAAQAAEAAKRALQTEEESLTEQQNSIREAAEREAAERAEKLAAEEQAKAATEEAAKRAAEHAAELAALQEAAELRAQQEADRLVAQHLAEQARVKEAREEQARAEAARLAEQKAAEGAAAEATRLAEEQAAELARAEAARAAEEQAAQAEAARLAEQKAAEEQARAEAAAEAARVAELDRLEQLRAEQQAELERAELLRAAQEAAEQEAAGRVAQETAYRARQQAQDAQRAQEAQEAQQVHQQVHSQVHPQVQQQGHPHLADPFDLLFSNPAARHTAAPQNFENPNYSRPQASRPEFVQPQISLEGEENSMPSHNSWSTPETQEPIGRPAWLSNDRPEQPTQAAPPAAPLPGTPEDTLQGSRDRLTSRWFALRGIFEGAPPAPEAIPAPVVARAPVMAVFSLAGGVGKTSMVATLGRALSARGERVLLVDTAAFGLLPFFFGATDQRPGLLRTFSPPGVSSDAPVQLVTIDPDGLATEVPSPESLSGEIQKFSRGASRVIVDLATASGSTTRRIMRMSPLVLVPVIPDMNSVVSVSSIDAFFEHNSNPTGKAALPFYVLNQFDASLPLHLDVREVLREQLGDRLLPFALRRSQSMSEALAEGMTVMDYAPNTPLAEDFSVLAGWVKSLAAPAITSYRGVRWSER